MPDSDATDITQLTANGVSSADVTGRASADAPAAHAALERRRNVFVIGLDAFNHAELRTVQHADWYVFHQLLPFERVVHAARFPIHELLEEATAQLRAFDGPIDAIVGYWDFPANLMVPILRRRFGLPSPSYEAVLRCDHKYWSRLLQREVVPECVPEFRLLDPFDPDVMDRLDLSHPFWLKPVKSYASYLAFRIGNRRQLKRALARIRERIDRLAEPFDALMQYAELPDEIAAVGGRHCLAEHVIAKGRQCTVEGYSLRGHVHVYGVVDSIRSRRKRSVFHRYVYPSTLPRRVQRRMADVSERLVRYIGLDDACFNIEFFYDKRADRLWLLEINPRISRSHCPLFELVDGASHQQVMLATALGREPHMPRRQGPYRYAAKFMLRRFCDGVVERVPGADDVQAVRARFPEARVRVLVQPGQRLSQLRDQDSYSYELAEVFLGADSPWQLLEHYHACEQMLAFRFAEA